MEEIFIDKFFVNKIGKRSESIFSYDAKRGGVFCDAYKIAPWPGVIWRRTAILDCVKSVPELVQPFETTKRKKFIEVGFGSGVFAYEFFRMGFECSGYDYSIKAVETANQVFNQKNRIIDFRHQLDEKDFGKYDCLGAFEILEHIEDDGSALKEWRELLKPGGFLVMSVPAKMKYWNYVDLRAGHIRRYEKDGLTSLLTDHGFHVVRLLNWGFPISNLTRYLRNVLVHKPAYQKMKEQNQQEMTQVSGIERAQEYKFKKFLPFRLIQALGKFSRFFYRFDWGDGYVVLAQKSGG